MKIKNLFDEMKKIGKKQYYFKNGEEEVYFTGNLFEIEIININDSIDIVITYNGIRNNYAKSSVLSNTQKLDLKFVLSSTLSLNEKAKKISGILMDVFSYPKDCQKV